MSTTAKDTNSLVVRLLSDGRDPSRVHAVVHGVLGDHAVEADTRSGHFTIDGAAVPQQAFYELMYDAYAWAGKYLPDADGADPYEAAVYTLERHHDADRLTVCDRNIRPSLACPKVSLADERFQGDPNRFVVDTVHGRVAGQVAKQRVFVDLSGPEAVLRLQDRPVGSRVMVRFWREAFEWALTKLPFSHHADPYQAVLEMLERRLGVSRFST